MDMFESRLLQNSGYPLQGVVFWVGRGRAAVAVVVVAFPDAVGATPVMPITSFVVDDWIAVVLALWDTDRDAKDEDSGVISVTRLLGTGVRDSDDKIEESCADTDGVKAVHSNRGIVGETMRIMSIVEWMAGSLCRRTLKWYGRSVDSELEYLCDAALRSQTVTREYVCHF